MQVERVDTGSPPWAPDNTAHLPASLTAPGSVSLQAKGKDIAPQRGRRAESLKLRIHRAICALVGKREALRKDACVNLVGNPGQSLCWALASSV